MASTRSRRGEDVEQNRSQLEDEEDQLGEEEEEFGDEGAEILDVPEDEEDRLLNDDDEDDGMVMDTEGFEGNEEDEEEDDTSESLEVAVKKFKAGNGQSINSAVSSNSRGGMSLLKNIQASAANGDSGDGSDLEIIEEDDDQLLQQQHRALSEQGVTISRTRGPNNGNFQRNKQQLGDDDDEDDIVEIPEEDPLSDSNEARNLSIGNGALRITATGGHGEDTKKDDRTIVVNDTKSLVELANSKKDPGKEPTLVIIDTNALISGKGPVPLEKSSSSTPNSSKQEGSAGSGVRSAASSSAESLQKYSSSLTIPDDAFLIEAPSFIVPYVFEQPGDKTLQESIKKLEDQVKKAKEAKVEKGEDLTPEDDIQEYKKPKTEDYFEGPIGRLLMNVGMNLVQEFVQVDLLKIQKRKADKEKSKGRSVTMETKQSILSLERNIDSSKENNEPFKFDLKRCAYCNYRSESDLVLQTHLQTPHMRNYSYRCNFCDYNTRVPNEIMLHVETEHFVVPRLERAPAFHQCTTCPFEDNSKAKINRHIIGCQKRFKLEKNLDPPIDWDTPAKLPKLVKNRLMQQTGMNPAYLQAGRQQTNAAGNAGYVHIAPKYKVGLPPLLQAPKNKPVPGLIRTGPKLQTQGPTLAHIRGGMNLSASQLQLTGNQLLSQIPLATGTGGAGAVNSFFSKVGLSGFPASAQLHRGSAMNQQAMKNARPSSQPSISITPLPRPGASPMAAQAAKQAQAGGGKTSFVICEICDGYIKDLDQLRNHMQWIHKVKIHPKMIYNKPPLNCQKCQFRFFTDQGLERHLLGSHGLVTSSMQEASNKGQDGGRCPLCGKVYQWKLLAHVAKDHDVTLKPAHLSYKCTVCTATFGMYKLFESHVYSAHSMTAKKGGAGGGGQDRRSVPQANTVSANRSNSMQIHQRQGGSVNQSMMKAMKINDEITIIPQPLANSNPSMRNKGSLTITPQGSTSRRNFQQEDEGIQIIEIDDAPKMSANGRNSRENGEFRSRLPISDSTLRKRNLEISVCGTDSDNSEDSFRSSAQKRIRTSNLNIN